VNAEIRDIAIFTTLAALAATAVMLVPGVAVAWLLARKQFPGKSLVETVVSLPLVMPPVATGRPPMVGGATTSRADSAQSASRPPVAAAGRFRNGSPTDGSALARVGHCGSAFGSGAVAAAGIAVASPLRPVVQLVETMWCETA
jgi:hypothetical protein